MHRPSRTRGNFKPRPAHHRGGFTLVELLVTACVLLIVLSLAVSLSRHVRAQSARVLTSDVLVRAERLLDAYLSVRSADELDRVTPLLLPGESVSDGRKAGPEAVLAEEAALLRRAVRNNREWLRLLMAGVGPELLESPDILGRLPLSIFDPRSVSLRDAWGTPVVLVRTSHPVLGVSPGDTPFFLSAGPDRRFLTVADNLYSYEAYPRPN